MTTGNHIREFFTARPALIYSAFAKEAKVPRRTLQEIVNGSNPLPKTIAKLLPNMRKYGYTG